MVRQQPSPFAYPTACLRREFEALLAAAEKARGAPGSVIDTKSGDRLGGPSSQLGLIWRLTFGKAKKPQRGLQNFSVPANGSKAVISKLNWPVV